MAHVTMVVSNGHHPDPRVHKTAIVLSDKGHDIEIIAFDRNAEFSLDEEMTEGTNSKHGFEDKYTVIRFRAKNGKGIKSGSITTLNHIRRFRKQAFHRMLDTKPGIVYLHDADTLEIVEMLQRLKNTSAGEDVDSWKKPVVVFDMHDLAHTWALWRNPKNPLRRLISKRMKNTMLKRAKLADLVITSSSKLKKGGHPGFQEWLEANGINAQSVPNLPLFKKGIENFTPQQSWPESPTIGYIGRIRDRASFDLLARALESMSPKQWPHLRIAGDGIAFDFVKERFWELSSRGLQFNMSEGFKLNEIPQLMAGVSVMYCLYDPRRGNILQGALPVKMYDAAQHGRPVICNDDCLMADLVDTEGFSGEAVKWGEVEVLKKSIIDLTARVRPKHISYLKSDFTIINSSVFDSLSSD